jgi:hypothetical protein
VFKSGDADVGDRPLWVNLRRLPRANHAVLVTRSVASNAHRFVAVSHLDRYAAAQRTSKRTARRMNLNLRYVKFDVPGLTPSEIASELMPHCDTADKRKHR